MKLSHKHAKFLKVEPDEAGNVVFSFRFCEHLPLNTPVAVCRLSQKETINARKLYKRTYEVADKGDGIPRHRYMSYLVALNDKAHKENKTGPLDGKLSEEEIEQARQNIIPKGFGIHHVRPVALQGGNAYNNLILVADDTHKAIHKSMDCLLAHIPYLSDVKAGKARPVLVRFPLLDKCVTNESGLFTREQLKMLLGVEPKTVEQASQKQQAPMHTRITRRDKSR